VLQVLKDNQLTAKKSNEFGLLQIEYSGHLISENGVATNSKKIKAIKEWPIPRCVKQLRGFLDLTEYYKKFIQGYGLISKPLTDLLKKNAFKWNTQTERAFNDLKKAMCSAPILVFPNFTQEFILETDASDKSVGTVLMQGRRLIVFLSKSLGIKSQSLSTSETYEKELLTFLTAVSK
jgi:RNase H-like domain found in reverse transcriptase